MTQTSQDSTMTFEQYAHGAIVIRNGSESRSGTLQAFVRGVPLGEAVNFDPAQSHTAVPCTVFPHVTLPAEVRIGWQDGIDAIAPLEIDTLADVNTLVGHGNLSDINISFRNALISGTARNTTNGIDTPMLIGRINGTLLRPVEAKVTGPHEEGGSRLRFSMPVEASDFSDRGATFELLQAPDLQCVWRTVLAPADVLAGGGIEMDVRLSEAERKLADAFASAEIKLTTRIARQNNLIEDVTAYLLALINDHANGASADKSEQRKLARDLIAKAQAADLSQTDQTLAVVGPLSPYMGWGWTNEAPNKDRLETRRMGAAATVLNPHADRAIKAVAVTVVEADTEALANMTAKIDGSEASIDLDGAGGAPCTVLIRPSTHVSGSVVSLSCTRPGKGIHVQDIRFFYV